MLFFFSATAYVRIVVVASAVLAGSFAFAQSFVQVTPINNQLVLNGTLLSTTVTITGSSANLSAAPSINPGFNLYDIWDNAPTPNPPGLTPAAIYPPSAKGNVQFVFGAPGSSTAAAPYRVTTRFGQAVENPVMLVYSLDNSAIDLSPTRNRSGGPAIVSFTGNPAAVINVGTQTVGANTLNANLVTSEGCWVTQARACAVIRFTGSYNEIAFNAYSVNGGQDGIGFQFGASAVSPPPQVPTLSAVMLGGLILLMLLAMAWTFHARTKQD